MAPYLDFDKNGAWIRPLTFCSIIPLVFDLTLTPVSESEMLTCFHFSAFC